MTKRGHHKEKVFGHKIVLEMVLCLFAISLVQTVTAQRGRGKGKTDERVYLVHSDELKHDAFGTNPDAQIVKGNVHFRHAGSHLWCDSAYYYQESNSFRAFGHVRFTQGDTLSLTCDRARYDGQNQMMEARRNVVLRHRKQTLRCDSLNYDRFYGNAYFFDGGELIDGNDRLTADWGQYNTETREAEFYYNVRLTSPKHTIRTDTLYYDTRKSLAHVVGKYVSDGGRGTLKPSSIKSGTSTIETENAYFDTKSDQANLYGRSTIVDKMKTIAGDTLIHDKATGYNRGRGNVIYVDRENKNELHCEELVYNEVTGAGYATTNALVKEYSQADTLFMHADTLRIETFNIDTDSVYRKVHGYRNARAYRTDVQAVCDSLVFSSLDTCMTMYKDPIAWNENRQLLGEEIKVYLNDSTVREAHVLRQALSIERLDDLDHYNQVLADSLVTFFEDGKVRRVVWTGNVRGIYYPVDDKDSTLMALNYMETDTMRMFLSEERQLEKICTTAVKATYYPLTQIPPDKYKLKGFGWFEEVRPKDKNDIFRVAGKPDSQKLKSIDRPVIPLQPKKGPRGVFNNPQGI